MTVGSLLFDQHAPRGTEQCALFMSHYLAGLARIENVQTGQRLSVAAMLGFLAHSPIECRLVHIDPEDRRRGGDDLWSEFKRSKRVYGEFIGPQRPATDADSFRIDAIVSPVDGMTALQAGSSGAVSVIAAGAPGSFLPDHENLPESYLVIALDPAKIPLDARRHGGASALLGSLLQSGMAKDVGHGPRVDHTPLLDFVRRTVNRLQEHLLMTRSVASWATHENPNASKRDGIPSLLRQTDRCYPQITPGSSVAAALAALRPRFGIDVFIGVTRRHHAIQIAVATHATGCELVAIPLAPDALTLDPHQSVETHHTLVPGVTAGHDVSFALTGITSTPLVDKVVLSHHRAVTNSLAMRSTSRAIRDIRHEHYLPNKPFRFMEPDADLAEVLETLKTKLGLKYNYLGG